MNETQSLVLLENITQEQSKVLGDIAVNILNGNLKLSQDKKTQIGKYKDFLRCIGDKGTSQRKRLQCIKNYPKACLTLIDVSLYKVLRLIKTK